MFIFQPQVWFPSFATPFLGLSSNFQKTLNKWQLSLLTIANLLDARFSSLLAPVLDAIFSVPLALVPLARILYSLWTPLIGQFEVDTNQAKNDQLFTRPGNLKYSGFRRSLEVSLEKVKFFFNYIFWFPRMETFWNQLTLTWWRRGWRFWPKEPEKDSVCYRKLHSLDKWLVSHETTLVV